MSLLRSKAMRVFLSDNGTLSDKTEELRTWGEPSVTHAWVAAQDALYIGRPHRFNYLYLSLLTSASNGASLTVSYWDRLAGAWKEFTDCVDETEGLSLSGFVSWDEDPIIDHGAKSAINWHKAAPADVPALATLSSKGELFWIRLTLSQDPSAAVKIQAIKTILSDDRLMKVVYPEVLNHLPSGQTDFMAQHELAKDAIVNELKVRGLIAYEEQIRDPEDWFMAATYKCIELILAPIVGDERLERLKKEMAEKAKATLTLSSATLDRDKDEKLDRSEVQPGIMRHLSR